MHNKIIVKGASEHNLKNIDVEIPRNRFVVFTGVSGSGKSSLAFDTLYAEGQRRYIESLSSYARQFLGQMEKPIYDYIEGLSPAVSIEQKSASKNPRSTVGTVTEIYDYLRVLFARIGTQYCYQCGKEVGSQTAQQMVEYLMNLKQGTRIQILAPLVQNRKGEFKELIDKIRQQGFVRVRINGIVRDVNENIVLDKKSKHTIEVVVDRIVMKPDIRTRLTDSIETTLKLSDGVMLVNYVDEDKNQFFSEQNACYECGISYPELSPQMFSFNSPIGMCPSCNGLGVKMELDIAKIIPDHSKSINEGAITFYGKLGERRNSWRYRILSQLSKKYNFSLDQPFMDIHKRAKRVLLYGSGYDRFRLTWKSSSGSGEFYTTYEGILPKIRRRYRETKSESARRYYQSFFSYKKCEECNGEKLRREARSVRIGGKSIADISKMSVKQALEFFQNLNLSPIQQEIAREPLKEITARLQFMINVGLYYLTLDRRAPTLSGGESERIRLASQIGSGLVGVMYILDEPTIGLHQRDNRKLLNMLLHLRDIGNTVIVVEHDEQVIRTADYILDFGPQGGIYGGEIVATGTPKQIMNNGRSLTGKYLKKELSIEIPEQTRGLGNRFLEIISASQNNLKQIDVKIPLGVFTCITGVSGSGKSSLINQTLYPALANILYKSNHKEGNYKGIRGIEHIDKVINIDQNPIGRTPRSNPATYTKVFDEIRNVFARTPSAKVRGYDKGRFSFNVKGGRCETCSGNGVKKIEMHFLPDVYITCEECKGKRYNSETLQVKYKGKNIADVLDMDVQEAYEHFKNIPTIRRRLQTLLDVGLDYIKLGQSSTTLSGGEAQRVKLSRELSKIGTGNTLYILDEPTTGLHFHDIKKLIKVLNKLVDKGNTVVVIEHNLDVIKGADYIIDLGPEGGDEGGWIVATGTPREIANKDSSYTGKFLRKVLFPYEERKISN